MISAVLKVTEARPIASRLDDVPKWVWWLLALTLVALRSWFATGTGLFGNFGDSDDATRLI